MKLPPAAEGKGKLRNHSTVSFLFRPRRFDKSIPIQEAIDFLVSETAEVNRRCKASQKALTAIADDLEKKAERALQRLAREAELRRRKKDDRKKKRLMESIFGDSAEARKVNKLSYGRGNHVEDSADNEESDGEKPSTSYGKHASKKYQPEAHNKAATSSGKNIARSSHSEKKSHVDRSGKYSNRSKSEETGHKHHTLAGKGVSTSSQHKDKDNKHGKTLELEPKEKREQGLKRKHSPARESGKFIDRKTMNDGFSNKSKIGHGKTESREYIGGTTIFDYRYGTTCRLEGPSTSAKSGGAVGNGGNAKIGSTGGQDAGEEHHYSKKSYY